LGYDTGRAFTLAAVILGRQRSIIEDWAGILLVCPSPCSSTCSRGGWRFFLLLLLQLLSTFERLELINLTNEK
jgi:hypothetical protein